MTVFGSGLQARQHILTLLAVCRQIQVVYVVSRSLERAMQLNREMQCCFPSVAFQSVRAGDETSKSMAVRAADIICTATNSTEPLFDGGLVQAGCHVNCVGSCLPQRREVDDQLIRRAKVTVDCEAALRWSGDMLAALEKGIVNTCSATPITVPIKQQQQSPQQSPQQH